MLALIAFAVSMPLAFVLRAVQSRTSSRAYDAARERNGDMLGSISRSRRPARRRSGPTAPGEVLERRVHEAVEVKRRRADQGRAHRRLPVPVGRGLLGRSPSPRSSASASSIGPVERPDGRARWSGSSSSRTGSSNRSPSSPRCSTRPRPRSPGCAACSACSTSRSARRRRPTRPLPPGRSHRHPTTSRSRYREPRRRRGGRRLGGAQHVNVHDPRRPAGGDRRRDRVRARPRSAG